MRRLASLWLAGVLACTAGTDAPTAPALGLAAHDAPRFLALPTNDAVWSTAYGVSDAGWMAGEVDVSDVEWHAARWFVFQVGRSTPRAVLHDLGMLNGRATLAFDVNDFGVVVGASVEAAFGLGPGPDEAFVYRHGAMHVLPTLGGEGAFARRINNRGWIVGNSTTADGESHATVWRPNAAGGYTPFRIGHMGGTYSWCNSITDDGRVVGLSETANGAVVAWVWDGHGPARPLPSVSPDGQNFAVDLNHRNLIVGNGTVGDFYHAARWFRSQVHDFHYRFPGFDHSFATAVNNVEEIAVIADVDAFAPRAYVVRGSRTIDLGEVAGSPLSDAYDINERGWVAGSVDVEGVSTASVWFLRGGWPVAATTAGALQPGVRAAESVDGGRAQLRLLRRELVTGMPGKP
jgi:probable HAF family extracellular repeat protein